MSRVWLEVDGVATGDHLADQFLRSWIGEQVIVQQQNVALAAGDEVVKGSCLAFQSAFLFRDDAEIASLVAAARQKAQGIEPVVVQAVVGETGFHFRRQALGQVDSRTAELDPLAVERLELVVRPAPKTACERPRWPGGGRHRAWSLVAHHRAPG